MTATYKIFKFSIVKNNCCDVIVNMKMFSFANIFIEIIDNSQTKRVGDLKILPDLEQGFKIKISNDESVHINSLLNLFLNEF